MSYICRTGWSLFQHILIWKCKNRGNRVGNDTGRCGVCEIQLNVSMLVSGWLSTHWGISVIYKEGLWRHSGMNYQPNESACSFPANRQINTIGGTAPHIDQFLYFASCWAVWKCGLPKRHKLLLFNSRERDEKEDEWAWEMCSFSRVVGLPSAGSVETERFRDLECAAGIHYCFLVHGTSAKFGEWGGPPGRPFGAKISSGMWDVPNVIWSEWAKPRNLP